MSDRSNLTLEEIKDHHSEELNALLDQGWDFWDACNKIRHPDWKWHQHWCGEVWFGPPDGKCHACEAHQQMQERLNNMYLEGF